MTSGLLGSDVPLAERYDVGLVDLDGVAYRGHEPIDGAAESLASARGRGMRLVFVTNNASREPESVARQLTELGIPTEPREIFTAALAAAKMLTTRLPRGAKVLVIGGAGLVTAVRAAGFTMVDSADDGPLAVVQGFSPELGWAQLAEAAYAIERGAWHVASNLDLSLPTARGLAPGNGSLVRAVQSATNVAPTSAGKPSPELFRMAVDLVGGSTPLVIGDRLDTDLAGAHAAGYPGLHVLTGVSSARDDVLAAPDERPDFIGADLRALLVPHPRPARVAEGWWSCREAAARVVDGRLQLHPSSRGVADVEAEMDVVRAACAAAWAAVDADHALDAASVPELGVQGTGSFGAAG